MKIKARMTCDLVDYHRRREKDGGTEASIVLETSVKPEEAKTIFGTDFVALSFALMRTSEGEDGTKSFAYLAKSVKPDASVIVLENHALAIDDEKFTAQPKIEKVSGVSGEQRVLVTLSIPLPDAASTRSAMEKRVGKSVEVVFEPAQLSLGLTTRKAANADAVTAPAPKTVQ